ncbi:MAG: hypothetical protein EOO47_07270 [Flavobacterium sp.]|nr:MAG: hypothetical protein EOO47_07270 [Flavobacterium sp.]
MVKFLSKLGSSNHLEELIKGTKDNLTLISPSFQLTENMKAHLCELSSKKLSVTLVFEESTLNPEENNWLKGLSGIKTSFCKDLQSMCYMNENEAIVTSIGLLNFSKQNNSDMGIYITKDKDKSLFESTLEEVQRLINLSYETHIC